jgi:hypothetical protein
VLFAIIGIGCATPTPTPPEPGAGAVGLPMTLDGLVKYEIDRPGLLYLREAHQIGSYDAFQIATSPITYERRSRRLPADLEAGFAARMEQTLRDAAAAAVVPVEAVPGPCVLQIGIGLEDVYLAEETAATLAEMTLVMEFRDSESGQPLLRYVTPERVENRGADIPWHEQIRSSFDDMVARLDLGSPMRSAGLADDRLLPGCKGTLAGRGSGAATAE